jgi:hypothetical protein
MAAPAFIRSVGFDFNPNTGGDVVVPITNAPTAGNFLFLIVQAAHREASTPSEPTWTDPSGWSLIDSKYYALADGADPTFWWAQTRIYWKTATASESAVTISSTANGRSFGSIEEFSAATVVSSQSYYGVNAAPSPADTYSSGITDRSVFWAITAPKFSFGAGSWTEVNIANFVRVRLSSVSGTGSFYKGLQYFDNDTSGTIDLPRLDQVSQDFALNRFPWAAIAVEIKGFTRGIFTDGASHL